MKIIHITYRYFPHVGGYETLVKEVGEKFSKKGHELLVYTLDRNKTFPKKQRINDVEVRRYKPLFGDPLYLPPPKFFWDIRSDTTTVLHVHDIHALPPLLLAFLKRNDQKIVLQSHYHRFAEGPVRRVFFSLYKRLLNLLLFPRVDVVIANSHYEKKILKEDFPRCKRVTLVPEGIEVNELKSIRWNPDCPKRILYVGSLRKYKNVDKLLQAFSFMLHSKIEKLKLVIDGDGPEKRHLMALACKLNLDDYVEWKHHLTRKELLSEYAKAQVLVLLSPLESFGRVIHEALIIGVPTIALNKGATAELVKNGLVMGVSSTQEEELAYALGKALDIKKTKISLKQLATMDMDQYSNTILKLYEDLMKKDSLETDFSTVG